LTSGAPVQAALEQEGQARQAEAQNKIGQREHDVDLDRLGEHQGVDLGGDEGHFGQADDVAERGGLDGRHQLAHQRGQHVAQRLRQDHQAQRLAVGQAERTRAFQLALSAATDAGATISAR
jgi:hypothetical protein